MDSNLKIPSLTAYSKPINENSSIKSALVSHSTQLKPLEKLPLDLGIFLRSGSANVNQWAHHIKSQNSSVQLKLDPEVHCLENLLEIYIQESNKYGLNSDILITQMCWRTQCLRYPEAQEGLTSDQNNFGGLGSLDPTTRGATFDTARIGILAHVQHLFGYASSDPLKDPCVDPRFFWIDQLNYRGSIADIFSFEGRWATDPEYGASLEKILVELYNSNLKLLSIVSKNK